MRFALFLFMSISASACSLGFNYQQCDTDVDCAGFADQPYCTEDHLCVVNRPPSALCAERYPETPAAGAVAIGALFDLNPIGLDVTRILALKLGVDEINDQSRFNRSIRPLDLNICDTSKAGADRKNDLERMITYLVNERKALGIIGPTTNADAKDVLSIIISLQVPLISPAAAAATIGEQQGQGYFFRTAPADNLQAQKLAQSSVDFPNNNPPTSPVILTVASEQSDFGESVRQTFQDKWDDRNAGNVPSATPTFPESIEATDKVQTVAAGILSQDPAPTHVLIVVNRPAQEHVLTLLATIKDLKTYQGNKPTKLWLTDGALAPNLLPLTTEMGYEKLVQNLEGVSPLALDRGVMGTRLTQTASEYRANMLAQKKVSITPEAGDYDVYIGYTYDAFYALAMAVESLRGTDAGGPQVASALRRIKSTQMGKQFAIGPGSFGSFVIGVNSLQSGGEVSLSGVTGAIRFSAQGDREPGLFERWKMEKVTVTGMDGMMTTTSRFAFKPF